MIRDLSRKSSNFEGKNRILPPEIILAPCIFKIRIIIKVRLEQFLTEKNISWFFPSCPRNYLLKVSDNISLS